MSNNQHYKISYLKYSNVEYDLIRLTNDYLKGGELSATKALNAYDRAITILAKTPYAYPVLPELACPYRKMPILNGDYVLLFVVKEETKKILIARIFPSKMDWVSYI